jgi:hypothetical protein
MKQGRIIGLRKWKCLLCGETYDESIDLGVHMHVSHGIPHTESGNGVMYELLKE